MIDMIIVTIYNKWDVVNRLSNDICIWPWLNLKIKVNDVHNSTANILEMVTYVVKIIIPSNNELYVGFRLWYLHLTLDNSKCQGQERAHFDNYYIRNDEIHSKITVPIK